MKAVTLFCSFACALAAPKNTVHSSQATVVPYKSNSTTTTGSKSSSGLNPQHIHVASDSSESSTLKPPSSTRAFHGAVDTVMYDAFETPSAIPFDEDVEAAGADTTTTANTTSTPAHVSLEFGISTPAIEKANEPKSTHSLISASTSHKPITVSFTPVRQNATKVSSHLAASTGVRAETGVQPKLHPTSSRTNATHSGVQVHGLPDAVDNLPRNDDMEYAGDHTTSETDDSEQSQGEVSDESTSSSETVNYSETDLQRDDPEQDELAEESDLVNQNEEPSDEEAVTETSDTNDDVVATPESDLDDTSIPDDATLDNAADPALNGSLNNSLAYRNGSAHHSIRTSIYNQTKPTFISNHTSASVVSVVFSATSTPAKVISLLHSAKMDPTAVHHID